MKTAGSHQASGTFPMTSVLLSTVQIDVDVATKQTIYTVPAGKSLIVTRVVARNASAALTAPTQGGFGGDANCQDYVYPDSLHAAMTATDRAISFISASGHPVYAAAAVFGWKAANLEGSSKTVWIDLFGYLV